MRIVSYTIMLISCAFISYGQFNFAVSEIPAELKEDMDAVVRFDKREFYIENKSAVSRIHWAVTIFNDAGEQKHARFEAYYDKFSQIKRIEGTIYDESGKLLKKLKSSEIKDIGLSSFGQEVTDNRVKTAEFDKKYYPFPYTVEFSFEEKSTNMMFYPQWVFSNTERTAYESSVLILSAPEGFSYHKADRNLPSPSVITKKDGRIEERWEIKNFKVKGFEQHSKNSTLPYLLTAPKEFQINDLSGKIRSWEDIASFYHSLNRDRDKLKAETVAEITDLTKHDHTTVQKIQTVYKYVQSGTRYQNISLGIGGWQSMPAMEVAAKKFGDCKALTNYTVSLLKVLGIEAFPALVYGGKNGTREFADLPRMGTFNHVIACIPVKNDTIWLECTSQDAPFGYLGSFTGNRQALLIKPSGGAMVNTTHYSPESNAQTRTANIRILENGDGAVSMQTTYSGLQQDSRADIYTTLSLGDQKDWLLKNLGLPDFRIGAINTSLKKDRLPELKERLDLEVVKLCTVSGKRMFLKPNLFETFINLSSIDENRKEELFLNPNSFNFYDTDSLVFQIPAHFDPEYLPKEVQLKQAFGEYRVSVTREGNALIYRRSLRVQGGTYPKEMYAEWINFIKKVNSTDKQRIVLVNKNG